jgi:hypothetical protein
MTWQEMIDFARTISWWLSTSQLPTATAIKYANIGYHKVKREIINLKEDFFWDILKVDDTVVNQNEYTIPAWLTGNYKDVSKTMAVSIKYSDTTDYIKCDKQYQYQLTEDLDYYKTTQWQTNPFFFIADNSYFIFPTPTVAVSEWIKIYWIKNLIDITESTTEVNIFDWKIPTEYHYIVPLYIRYMYYMSRWVDFKQDTISAKADFDIALQEITDWLWQRDMSIIYKKKP